MARVLILVTPWTHVSTATRQATNLALSRSAICAPFAQTADTQSTQMPRLPCAHSEPSCCAQEINTCAADLPKPTPAVWSIG